MSKKVALVGHCGPDGSYLKMVLGSLSAQHRFFSADDDESLGRILTAGVDLLLFNRVLDFGFDETEGIALIRKLHHHYPKLKMMLVSNFPEAQAAAVAAGALAGFGKRDLGSRRVKELLASALSADSLAADAPAATKPSVTE